MSYLPAESPHPHCLWGESAGPHPRPASLPLWLALFRLSSWLEEDDDPVVARVNRRMEHITGLTVKTAELLQVRLVPGTWVWAGVFLDTGSRLREACLISCMTAYCCDYGVTLHGEAGIKHACGIQQLTFSKCRLSSR